MSRSSGLLSQGSWQGVRVADIVRCQLAPYATDANTTICGPDVVLSAPTTEALGMVLHELVTNASKYGALSVPEGRVSVDWECRQNGAAATDLLAIMWHETGGPPVSNRSRDGYGTSLISGLIPHELGGTVELVFSPDGVNCKIAIPLKPDLAGVA